MSGSEKASMRLRAEASERGGQMAIVQTAAPKTTPTIASAASETAITVSGERERPAVATKPIATTKAACWQRVPSAFSFKRPAPWGGERTCWGATTTAPYTSKSHTNVHVNSGG